MNNLNLIIGEDQKLINFYLTDILTKIDYLEEDKITYDLNNSTISDVLDEASMISLFSNTKVIIGTNFDLNKLKENDINYLEKYLNNINKSIYIVLLTNKIDARKSSYKLIKNSFNIIDTTTTDNKIAILNYIKDNLKKNKYKMSDIDIEYFLSEVGNDLNSINSELSKLYVYKKDNKTITKEDIDKLIAPSIDNIAYEFTNAIIENDLDKVVEMYQNFKITNVSIDYLISLLANNFHQLLVIKMLHNDGANNQNIAKTIGKKEFYVKKTLERLSMYTEKDLSNYLTKLATIELNYKTGKSHIDELEFFLLTKNEA